LSAAVAVLRSVGFAAAVGIRTLRQIVAVVVALARESVRNDFCPRNLLQTRGRPARKPGMGGKIRRGIGKIQRAKEQSVQLCHKTRHILKFLQKSSSGAISPITDESDEDISHLRGSAHVPVGVGGAVELQGRSFDFRVVRRKISRPTQHLHLRPRARGHYSERIRAGLPSGSGFLIFVGGRGHSFF